MANWNPNSTNVKGPEWYPYLAGVVLLDSNIKSASMSLVQSTAQAIGTLKVGVGAIPTRGGLYAVEAYDGETAVSGGTLATLTAVPNEDVSGNGASAGQWKQQTDDATTTIYTEIDETTYSASGIEMTGPSSAGRYTSRFNTGSLTLTSKRVLAVVLRIYMHRHNVVASFSAGLNLAGSDHYAFNNQPISAPVAGPTEANTKFEKIWTYNPQTKLPWTIADIQALDTTDEWWVEGICTGSSGDTAVCYLCNLDVIICDETRLAVGVLDDTLSALTANVYNSATMAAVPSGTWTKDASGYHTYLARRLNSTGALAIPTLDSGTVIALARSYEPTIDGSYGYVTAMGSALSRLIPLIQRTTAPADSVDSQPYYALVTASVQSGQDTEQEISDAAVAAYKQVTVTCKPGSATAALSVKLKRRSDNTQFGTTATIPTSLAVGGNVVSATAVGTEGWYRIVVNLPTAGTLATGTQYYIEYSTTSTLPWSVVAGTTTTGNGETASFGGTTDRGLVNGTEADYLDVFTTIASAPVTPTGFVTTVGFQSRDETVCGVGTIARAQHAWNATVLGANFLRYEVERSDDGGITWNPVRRITTEATVSVSLYEAPRNITSHYRFRSVRTDGTASDWTASTTAYLPTVDCEMLFVSDYDPTLNCAYDREPEGDHQFLDAATATVMTIYGRDRQLGFQPTEELGVESRYLLHVGFDEQVPPGGGESVDAWAPLRAIAKAAIPYVCVLDKWATHQYAQLRVPSGRHQEPGARYVAEIIATEVTDVPYVVTSA